MLSEIHTVTIGVADLDRSRAFYEQTLGFRVWEEEDLDVGALSAAWRIPSGLAARYAVLAPDRAEAGFLRLIEWSRPGERVWGDYDNYPDLGLFAINFRVGDLKDVWAKLIRARAAVKAPVTTYKLGGMDVIDGQCFDPDGVIIDVHQISGDLTGIEEDQVQYCTPVASVSIHAGPVDVAKAFYSQLGFEVLYDKELTDLGPFLGFPEGLVLRNANLVKSSRSPHGRVELSDYVGKPAASRTGLAVPPNLGLLMLSFESDDFEADLDLLQNMGAQPGPATIAQFGSARRRLAIVTGPAGEALEIFEKNN